MVTGICMLSVVKFVEEVNNGQAVRGINSMLDSSQVSMIIVFHHLCTFFFSSSVDELQRY